MPLGADLIDRGYFPREVPPTFTSSSLAAVAVTPSLSAFNASYQDEPATRPARHNLARPNGLRRPLSIPNPIHYLQLCGVLDANWAQIQAQLNKSSIASSSPVQASGPRAFEPKHSDSADRRTLSRAGARYLLKADIQSFYPSVYTHSVPWAFHTKPVAKARRRDMSLVGNAIDRVLQNSQDAQTLGIPIGPDASWVIAECLMAAVEDELRTRLTTFQGHRYLDDFEFVFGSLSDAESALGDLQEILSHYELMLNPTKTKIVELPSPVEESGIAELRRWEFRDGGVAQRNDLRAYFDRVAELVSENQGGNIASYAIGRLSSEDIDETAWPILESQLLQLLVAEPSCAQQVAIAMSMMTASGHSPTTSAITNATERLAVRHAALGHGSEIAWALWISIANGARVTECAAAAVSKMEDSLVALLALHANSIGYVSGGLDTSVWSQFMTPPDLRRENWLLAYEASVQGWLSSPSGADHISEDAFFSNLRSQGVRFYDTRALTVSSDSSQAFASGGGGGY